MRRIEFTPQGEVPFGASSLQGDQALAGFEELAMPLSHSLYNFARWLAHNRHDAEDLVQETYLKALRSFASFEPGTNFRAWMFKILRNTFLTSCSKQEHRRTIPMDMDENPWAPPATSDTPESLLIKHFDSVTSENDMKWDATERTEGTFSFAAADAQVALAGALLLRAGRRHADLSRSGGGVTHADLAF